jgi:hypothetical protein
MSNLFIKDNNDMLGMSTDSVNFIGQFKNKDEIFKLLKEHDITSIHIGEFTSIKANALQTGYNFYTFMEMDHKIRIILKNCVWNRIPGVQTCFQEELVREFDKMALKWLMKYGHTGIKEQAINVKKYQYDTNTSKFEEVECD